MRQTLRSLMVAAALMSCVGLVRADDKSSNRKEASLGVSVEPVPSVLHSQMHDILPKGEGVLIAHVVKDSAAAKAGLQMDDILVSYGDQKVFSPEQLVKLVRADKPGHEIAIGLIRNGKALTSKVVVGETEASQEQDNRHVFRFKPNEQFQTFFEEAESKNGDAGWDTFDEMKLTRTDAKHWRAAIEYRSKEGKKEAKDFTGTREEIRKSIQADKDLPTNERAHLLRALNLQEPVLDSIFLRQYPCPILIVTEIQKSI